MAEYYPLLAKAVASLPSSTPDTRRVIYERARKALLGQLRNLQPAIADEDIARESDALDGAVARLETEFAASHAPPAVSADPPAIEPPAVDIPPAVASPVADAPPLAAAPPPVMPEAASGRPPLLAPRPRVPRPPPVIPARPVSRVSPAAGRPEPPPADSVAPAVAALHQPAEAAPLAPPSSLPPAAPPPPSDVPIVLAAADAGSPDAPALQVRPEPQRPFAPQPPRPAAPQRRTWIVAAVVGMIVAAVAVAAFKLRDRPEDLTRMKAAAPTGDTSAGGKIVDRVGGTSSNAAASSAAAVPASSQPAQTAASAAPAAAQQQATPALGVQQRAALLVEAPDEPGKVKTYVGTVVWKLDNVSNGPGQPLTTAVRADVDIPEDKMQVSLVFQKNLDATLPASHTIKIRFTVAPDSPTGGVRQINVPQMRRDDTPSGESLSGIPVPITDNVFLIGLARGTQEDSNIDLLRTRAWVDMPMMLTSGRIAKVTLEKSTSGQHAFDVAIASWQQPSQ